MKELVVISGKGGVGKTSVLASFATMSSNAVIADCDVDAPDLHIILKPRPERTQEFTGGKTAVVDRQACTECGECLGVCRFEAISGSPIIPSIDPLYCQGCGLCKELCPFGAIKLEDDIAGKWFISQTRAGPMVHAQLGIAQENSGKLVTVVRNAAREVAKEKGRELVLIDGPPGIGCPVIASIVGSSLVLAITEPTVSGIHDLKRVMELARHFKIKIVVCINKYDLSSDMSRRIEDMCYSEGVEVIGKIPYDNVVTRAQLLGKTVCEIDESEVSKEIYNIWNIVNEHLE